MGVFSSNTLGDCAPEGLRFPTKGKYSTHHSNQVPGLLGSFERPNERLWLEGFNPAVISIPLT